MGIPTQIEEQKKRSQPRANTESIIGNEVVANIHRMMKEYREVRLTKFVYLYQIKFHELLDSNQYPRGLIGLLESQTGFIDLVEREGDRLYAVLREEESSSPDLRNERGQSSKTKQAEKRLKFFTDAFDCALWRGQEHLLSKDYEVLPSAYELALIRNPEATKRQVASIRRVLSKFPNGLRLNELSLHVGIDLNLFNIATNINALTNELTEVFFRVDKTNDEPMLYNGFEKTYHDLNGLDSAIYEGIDPRDLVSHVVGSGLYLKTLLLIRDAGPEGLKLNVWVSSIERNFACSKAEKHLLTYGIKVFFALARYGYVQIFSAAGCKNDLRVTRRDP